MVRRNTWILLVLLAALVGFSFYMSKRKAAEAAAVTPTAGSTTLFSSAEGAPNDIKIVSGIGTSVEVARDSTGKWVVKAPTQAPADQAAAEAGATQVSALRLLSKVQLGLNVVGLDKPAYTITIIFTGGKTHMLEVGSVTPIQDGYYTRLDGASAVQVVDKPGLDALLNLLTNPPYVPTPTPVESPTPSPEPATPTSAGTAAPSVGGTAPSTTEIVTATP